MYILQNGYLCDSHWPWATPHQRYCPNKHNMQLPSQISPISCNMFMLMFQSIVNITLVFQLIANIMLVFQSFANIVLMIPSSLILVLLSFILQDKSDHCLGEIFK